MLSIIRKTSILREICSSAEKGNTNRISHLKVVLSFSCRKVKRSEENDIEP